MDDREREVNKELQNDIKNRLENISDKLLKSFTKRSIRDAEKIIDIDNEKFSDVAYAIYKGYCIGFVMGNIDKIANKEDKEK